MSSSDFQQSLDRYSFDPFLSQCLDYYIVTSILLEYMFLCL